jgi:TonB-dependent receptor
MTTTDYGTRRKPLSYAISIALASFVASNFAAGYAVAQETPGAEAVANDAEIKKVVVQGTRASQQSGIERKKNAATAMDSIVAEDVGSFPDRNIGEAISRIAGVALDRGDFGEGVSVAIRGNSADLTRVEIDGQGVQGAGGTDMNGGGGGRGTEFRSLSADLIKSVDVVKGSTPDMTEGSLGGGVIIKTRTSLDFKEPFVSLRVAGSQGSLNKEWSPDANLIATKKFMDNRLGVMINASTSRAVNESHSAQVATSANAGYSRALDFDNSPNKTFSYLPSTLSKDDPSVNQPTLQSAMTGGGFFNAATPMEILTKSAAAQTKADCYAAFPNLTDAQKTSINGATAQNAAINTRGNELMSCLNQWNDYTPSLVRYVQKRQEDKRNSLDLRFDFKVNNELSVYAKGNYAKRKVDDTFMTYGLGGLNVNTATVNRPGYLGPSFSDTTGVRTAVPGSGYYLYDNMSFRTSAFPIQGAVANVDPRSVVVDANHHVTQMTITDGSVFIDQIFNAMETTNKYFQTGGTYRNGGLVAEFFYGDGRSKWQRGDKRTSWGGNYGTATMKVLPNGLWTYEFPAGGGFDQTNPAIYAGVFPAGAATTKVDATINNPLIPAYSINQQPLTSQAPQITFSPKMAETQERTAKADFSYALSEAIPFFKRIKTGFNLRDTSGSSWGAGGNTIQAAQGTFGQPGYVAPIILPTANVRSFFQACQNTAGSLGAGGKPCQTGYVQNTNLSAALSGTTYMNQQQFLDIIAQSMKGPNSTFFNGQPDRPAELINSWNQIDVEKVFSLVGSPNVNFNCVKECVASDGKVYQQPVNRFKERVTAGYFMTDFGFEQIPFTDWKLPFNMEFDGNFGYRVVRTKVQATGTMGFTSIYKTAAYNELRPNDAAGIVSSTLRRPTTFHANTTDYMPILNTSLWLMPDQLVLRYNRAKQIARPPVDRLMPAGDCTYDQRRVASDGAELADQTCGSIIGNPALRAQVNNNQNLALEWYPNNDTSFSVATFRQVGKVGANVVVGRTDVKVFEGSDVTDPQTGKPVGDLDFDYRTYENGPNIKRTGVEFSGKTAFTFLPWKLRYTGVDFNYTKLKSSNTTVRVVDLLTGEELPPIGESKYTYNAAVWYDDGALSARIALQAVGQKFNCIAGCGANSVNNYPNAAGGRITVLPYNPGSPTFKDATRYVDAKISYRINKNLEIFAEGRNLNLSSTTNSQAHYAPFADGTPNILDTAYAGRRIMIGVNLRN